MAKKRQITKGGNFPQPGQRQPNTIILTQPQRFGIDISTYMAAIRSYENVDFARRTKLIDLLTDILMDTHLSSVVSKRKSAILCSPVEFRRAGKPDESINEQLRSPWFYNFLGDALDAPLMGDTLVQFFRDKKTGWLTYEMIPRKHYDPVRHLILRQQTDITGEPWDEYADLLFIGKEGVLGELAKAAPWVIYKRNTTADWAQFSEVFGQPIRKYTYESGDEESRAQVMNDAQEQGGGATYVLPKDCNLEFVEASNKTGSSDLYRQLVEICNAEISKLILGNTLTTEAGDKGTQALGTVHGKVEDRIAQADRKFILNILNYEMTDIFARLGINTAGGEFVFVEPKNTSATEKMNIFKGAQELGLEISQEQMYEDLGLQRPTRPEDIVQRPKPEPTAPQQTSTTGPDTKPLPEEKEPDKPNGQPKPGKQPESRRRWNPLSWLGRFFGQAPGGGAHLSW